jgi:predicted alpha/beta-hydrolase family hydrolase
MSAVAFEDLSGAQPVRGFLHQPSTPTGEGLVLSHGAGSDARAPVLVKVAEVFADAGFTVMRFNLPFRQDRPGGSPHPSQAGRDREGIAAALDTLGREVTGPRYLGGHSYGGRQSTMLAAGQPSLPAAALLLLSYPLHPPGKPEQLRTAHFPTLATPALFLHGSRDPFGTIEELEAALRLVPGGATLLALERSGHDLDRGRKHAEVWASLPARLRAIARG